MNKLCPFCWQGMVCRRESLREQARYDCIECGTFGSEKLLSAAHAQREALERVQRIIERWDGKVGRECANEIRAALGRALS